MSAPRLDYAPLAALTQLSFATGAAQTRFRPMGRNARSTFENGADIKLCLDATEDIGRFAHVGTVIIVGGDSDFIPVSQKIKAAGRTLIGVGTRKATNRHWAKSCHEFRYYENLVEVREEVAVVPSVAPEAGVPAAAQSAESVPDGGAQGDGSAEVAAAPVESPAGPHVDLVRRQPA